jgi:CheY-like chemotaxis protein
METGGNILVVDDNDVFRMVVSKMLSRLGYEVSSADSGENGLNLFLKNKFDVVLSDYEMPGMDGVAFACSIKKTSPRTPVVIMTGAGRETVFSRKSTAVDEVISKPFTLAQIDKTIQNVSCITQCAHSLIELDRKTGYSTACHAWVGV